MNRHTFTAMTTFASAFLAAGSGRAADAVLVDAAKKEAMVVWYTTQPIEPLVLVLAAAFEKKYDIKVEYVRSNANELALRLVNEGKAGRVQADVYDGSTTAEALKKERLALKWLPDNLKGFAPEYIDPDGYWAATNDYVITVSHNTNLIKPGTAPKSWDDLLDLKYRGQMLWGSSPGIPAGSGFVGTVLKTLGEGKGLIYLKQLSTQRIANLAAASRVVTDQVIAGEYALALQAFPENAIFSAKSGAPIQWLVMTPAMSGIVSTAGVTVGGPHPNAGKLLFDYMMSEEGQKIYRDTFYIPTHPNVAPLETELTPGKHRVMHISPLETIESMPQWYDIYRSLFQ